ncbi:Fe-S cluster assembly protein SufD [Spiroplasma chinense]|uniref:Fe-S cluster assembly protein SufD n=1 Tax=Spiroplasma chinense TaxID=216932 RepID=A0A5B9Y615_9MOLU|nr:SufD family Fe-S cluster assembly protein [Spiroplasma chinense]QEH62139.1 Fe-S cluster assembly protein SufD [Spiroplasma chinense]
MFDLSNEANFIDLTSNFKNEINFSQSDRKILVFKDVDGGIKLDIEKNVELNLTIIFLPSEKKETKKFMLDFNLAERANLNLFLANLTYTNSDEKVEINLNEPGSKVEYYGATIAHKESKKSSIIKVSHLARETASNIKTYEVLKDTSNGFIRCISDIRKGSSSSEAHQELRLLVLDKNAKADSDPVLLIDENDIVASHANAIGMLDPEQIFYLQSRGLKKEQAQELIVNGYFEPVFLNLNDAKLEEELKKILKGMI